MGGFLTLFILTVIMQPVFQSAQLAAQSSNCISSVKNLARGVATYAADNDERLPPAESWRTASAGYRQPGDVETRCPNSIAPYTYAFNGFISRLKTESLTRPDKTVMIFEADGQTPNLAGTRSIQRKRHLGVTNVGYADGRAQPLRPLSPPPTWSR